MKVSQLLFVLLLLHFCLIILVPFSSCQDPRYEACAPSKCGENNVTYPFMVNGKPDYCGYPGSVVFCEDGKLILNLKSDNYTVSGIDYVNHNLSVINRDFEANSCPFPDLNVTLESTPYSFTSQDGYLSFFYCSLPISITDFSPIPCLSTQNNFAFFTLQYGMEDILIFQHCRAPVVVPVMKSVLQGTGINFSAALQQGFGLNWQGDKCVDCEKSGGRCGYISGEVGFRCFCYDGDFPAKCGVDSTGKKNVGLKIIIGISASAGTLLLTGAAFFVYYRRRKMKQTSPSSLFLTRSMSSDPPIKPDHEKGSTTQFLTNMPTLSLFTYKELEQATNSFNPSNELGDGGFGTVYYGKLRDGRSVAVKRLYENNYKRVEQFMNEVKILSGLRHQNLVCLYGCTSRHSRELLLVYEYIPNGTVADHLHGDLAKVKGGLNWSTRLKIALETAEALAFLHAVEPPIIHRDVKTNNILLDNSYQVKVADFGLSRLFPLDATHVSTAPQGTPGYVDPDYHQCYQLTDKSDVYSFGVVLVELISSKPAVDITRHRHEINLANLAINKIINRALSELVDQSLGFESDFRVRRMMTGVAELAFRCLSAEKEERPTMEEVLEILRGIEKDGIEGKTPKEQPEILADDVVLLKSQVPFSPDSVTEKWASRSTTPNTSNEG